MTNASNKAVAVIGGAVAGSEAARVLAEQGLEVVVFERQRRPFGKIEDGLPLWHAEQRETEYERISERLTLPRVHYVPCTALCDDITLQALRTDWGFAAVLLANGAWRDRYPGVSGIEQYIERGLVLQNRLVYWFNHYREADYRDVSYEVPDGTVIFGGGLASIDVAKIAMLETVGRALTRRGIAVEMITMERQGVAAILAEHSLTLADLGLQGCLLLYRRRKGDMPLAEIPEDAPPERLDKVRSVREKILDNAQRKYLFRYQERTLPNAVIAENGHLVGMRCQRTEITDGKVRAVAGSEFELRAPMFVSSLGSIPEPLAGIPLDGELYPIDETEPNLCTLRGHEHIYALGNVVTGKGNIRVSRKHGAQVAEAVAQRLKASNDAQTKSLDQILERVRARQVAVGYSDYASWIGTP